MYPILFHIGKYPVHAYGILIAIGFLIGLWRAMRVAHIRNEQGDTTITPDNLFDLGYGGLITGLIGARLLYVLLNWNYYIHHPIVIFETWQGGLSIMGAIAVGTLYILWYCRRKKLPFFKVADLVAPSFAIGYAIGRIGCFMNGCCYGVPSNLPWAVRFVKNPNIPGDLTRPRQPTQLYATGMNLIIFWLLTRWEKRTRADGEIFFGYIALYCLYRFIDEIWRKGATAQVFVGWFTQAQVACMAIAPLAILGWWLVRRHYLAEKRISAKIPSLAQPDQHK